jgi:hypothetical protein
MPNRERYAGNTERAATTGDEIAGLVITSTVFTLVAVVTVGRINTG